MAKLTPAVLAEMLEKKLSHNFGVTPDKASDELFYKASALVLLDIMSGMNEISFLNLGIQY